VEHAHAFTRCMPFERLVAVSRKPIDQQVLEAAELVVQDRVPRFDHDVVVAVHECLHARCTARRCTGCEISARAVTYRLRRGCLRRQATLLPSWLTEVAVATPGPLALRVEHGMRAGRFRA